MEPSEIVGLIPQVLPHQWAEVVGAVVALVVATRTGLRTVAWFAATIDTAIDGRVDWAWPDKLAHSMDWLDSAIGKAVVSALLPKLGAKK